MRISASLSPQHLIQAIFSKDPEEAERIELKMVTMSTRIDFVDHIISQELLDLVSKWNKGLRTPEYVFPFMKWVKYKTDAICRIVRKSVPTLTVAVCFSYFINYSQHLDKEAPLTGTIFTASVLWVMTSIILIYLSAIIGRWLASYIKKQLNRFGRFTSLELTKGDKNKQTEFLAKSRNSFWKFASSSLVALTWNVVGGIVTAILLKK